jgi:serine phosphatase RsbU (regulator of sigma subunit)
MAEKKKRVRKSKKEVAVTASAEEVEPKKAKKKKSKLKKARKMPGPTDSSVIYKTGEMPKMRGGGIGMRLAFVLSGAIFLIMVIVAIVMILVVSSAVDKQIDEGGVAAARLLAAADVDVWKGRYGIDELTQEREEQEKRLEFNKKRLSRVLFEDSQVLNAQIIVADDYDSFSTRRDAQGDMLPEDKKEAPQFRIKPGGSSFDVGEVKVDYGFMTVGNRYHDCRQYQCPIKNFEGERIGFASVVLSEAQISSQKWSLAGTIAVLFVIFIGLGVGMAFLVGRKITQPIKALIEDVTIVAGGDLSHHTAPQSGDEIGLLARTFDKMTKNLHEAQSREVELAKQKHQMHVAQEVQANLLPEKIPEVQGYEIVPYHRSSKEVHGTYYDVIRYPDGKVGILVAAASGTGIPAAMVMTMARSFFRSLGEKSEDPATMMKETNKLLSPDLRAGMYVEVIMVVLDPSSHKAKLVSAGPSTLFRFNFAEKKIVGIHSEGIALGFDKGPVFDKSLKEVEFEIGAGDRLVLNTPSVFTIKNHEGTELGPRGFAKAIHKLAMADSTTFVDRMVTILDNFAGHEIDDTAITFLTVRRKEA